MQHEPEAYSALQYLELQVSSHPAQYGDSQLCAGPPKVLKGIKMSLAFFKKKNVIFFLTRRLSLSLAEAANGCVRLLGSENPLEEVHMGKGCAWEAVWTWFADMWICGIWSSFIVLLYTELKTAKNSTVNGKLQLSAIPIWRRYMFLCHLMIQEAPLKLVLWSHQFKLPVFCLLLITMTVADILQWNWQYSKWNWQL